MSFDLAALKAAVAQHDRVVRVVIADLKGSSPREVGAAMLVWETGQSGTIGGGALEFAAAQAARRQTGRTHLSCHALGPELGQCCGGAVSLLSEVYDAEAVAALEGAVIARPVSGAAQMPLAVRRLLDAARARGVRPEPQLIDGWMVEPVLRPARYLWSGARGTWAAR